MTATHPHHKHVPPDIKHHRIPLPNYVTEFLAALQQDAIPYLLLADAVVVLDPVWQRAVEGRLGSERFTVIVDTEREQMRAKQLGEQLKYRGVWGGLRTHRSRGRVAGAPTRKTA